MQEHGVRAVHVQMGRQEVGHGDPPLIGSRACLTHEPLLRLSALVPRPQGQRQGVLPLSSTTLHRAMEMMPHMGHIGANLRAGLGACLHLFHLRHILSPPGPQFPHLPSGWKPM